MTEHATNMGKARLHVRNLINSSESELRQLAWGTGERQAASKFVSAKLR